MLTFDCELNFAENRYVTLRAEDGIVRIVGNSVLSVTDKVTIARYAEHHCKRSHEPFIRVDFEDRLTGRQEEIGDLSRPDRFDMD